MFIECNGSKCRQRNLGGVWCLSCYSEPDESPEDRCFRYVETQHINPKEVLFSIVKVQEKDDIDSLERELDNQRDISDEKSKELKKLERQLEELPNKIKELSREVNGTEAIIEKLKKKLEEKEEKQRNKLAELDKKRADLQRQLEELEGERKKLE